MYPSCYVEGRVGSKSTCTRSTRTCEFDWQCGAWCTVKDVCFQDGIHNIDAGVTLLFIDSVCVKKKNNNNEVHIRQCHPPAPTPL